MFRHRLGVLEGLGVVVAVPTSAEIATTLNAFIKTLTLANWRTLLGVRVLTTDGKTASAMTDAALSEYVVDLAKYLKVGSFGTPIGQSETAPTYQATNSVRLQVYKDTWTNPQIGYNSGLWAILGAEVHVAIVSKKDATYRDRTKAGAAAQEAAMHQYRKDRGQYTSADTGGMVKWIIGGLAAWFALKG